MGHQFGKSLENLIVLPLVFGKAKAGIQKESGCSRLVQCLCVLNQKIKDFGRGIAVIGQGSHVFGPTPQVAQDVGDLLLQNERVHLGIQRTSGHIVDHPCTATDGRTGHRGSVGINRDQGPWEGGKDGFEAGLDALLLLQGVHLEGPRTGGTSAQVQDIGTLT